MQTAITKWILTAAAIALASAVGGAAAQQQARQQPAQAQPAEPAKDYDQRALEIYEFRKAAQSGPHRGQEIYYYKCWMCHNELAQGGAPKLAGLFKRPTLVTGEPVNDETVKNQIRNGSPNMGAYKYALNEADLNDLVSWLHDDNCCWNNDAPPPNPRYKGTTAAPAQTLYASLTGGPKGLVKNARGEPIEGIMVQLIAEQNAIRTTVYSRADGRYEFPKVAPGTYTLRIAKPKEFYPWSKQKLEIKGADALEDITLLRVTPGEFLPPFPEIAAQLTGSEWLQNLPGTGEEKKTLQVYCNFCHEYQQIFRNHYDEAGWSKIIFRMTHGAGSPLINIRNPGRLTPAEEAKFAHWLATARGPDSKDPNFVVQPRPQGRATHAIITEYEVPRLEISAHDTTGDAQGRVWYSTHRSSYVGRLDPATGHVEEYHVPLPAEGSLPGTHWIFVDQKGAIWGSENWAHNIWTLSPDMKDFKRVHWNVQEPVNSPMGGNYALDDEGNIWRCREGEGCAHQRRRRQQNAERQDQEIRLHLWQRHELGSSLFRRRRLAARRHGDLRPQDQRGVRARDQPQLRPGARRVRSGRQLLGSRPRRLADQVRHQGEAGPRISAADPLHLALHRQGRQERRGLGWRAQRRPLSALRSQDRAVHRLHFARALCHGPRGLDRQHHQPGVGVVRGS